MPLSALLRCLNLDRTRDFYRGALGFDVREGPERTLTAARHGATLVFTAEDIWRGAIGFSGTLYFAEPDLDAYFATIKDAVEVAWPIQDMAYGSREFGIRDCNGYHLAFQQAAR